MVLAGGSRPGAPLHPRHPETPGEALQRRCLAGREALLGANHPETLTSMDNLAVLLWKQGKLAEAGLMVFGVRGDLPGRFTKGNYFVWPRPEARISFCFPVLLDDSWANQCTLIYSRE